MGIYEYQAAFGAADITSRAMRQAMTQWQKLYYGDTAQATSDPCQRIAYTLVSKLSRAVFGEYEAKAGDPVIRGYLQSLDKVKKEAVQLALMGGECYLKPCPAGMGFLFTLIPRSNLLVFARDRDGNPTDVGTMERAKAGKYYYTLLERRTVDEQGFLTIENKLYQSLNDRNLGSQLPVSQYPGGKGLVERFTYPKPVYSVGMARLRVPAINCVDGSADGVAVYAPAAQLIQAIDRNEAELNGEFSRGQSRILVSSDLLDKGALTDHVFVGLDEDPETAGITVFAPQLREQSYLARKQEYLRNVESVIGLKRGMLSDANLEERTATEIAASNADYALTVMELQQMWQQAAQEAVALCCYLAEQYRLPAPRDTTFSIDWGNGVLYDEDAAWERYMEMVSAGILKPEVALGWRFGMDTDSPEALQAIREKYMPV